MIDFIPKKFGSSYYNTSLTESCDVDNLWESFAMDFSVMFGNACYINKDGETVYEIEVPGFNKDNIHVDISDDILTVRGARDIKTDMHAGQKEIFKRINIGTTTDISAEVKDGILTLIIRTEKKDIRKLEIK